MGKNAIHSLNQLSKEARALVRCLLRDGNPGIDCRCPSESVAEECNGAGLLVQVEHPLHESRQMYPLHPCEFLHRAIELGFVEVPKGKTNRQVAKSPESKCLDFLGQEIKPGDTVVYPGRQSSRMWMNQAQVLSVDQNDRGWSVKVQRSDAVIRTITCIERVVVIQRSN